MEEPLRSAHREPESGGTKTSNVIHTSTDPPAATTRPTTPIHTSTHPPAATTRPTTPTTTSRRGDPPPAAGDPWTRQFRDRHLSLPEQRARAASLFVKLQILVYAVIILGISIVVVMVLI